MPPLPGDEASKESKGQTEGPGDEPQAQQSKPLRDELIPGQRTIKRLQKRQAIRQEDDMDIDSDSDLSFNRDQNNVTNQTETDRQKTEKNPTLQCDLGGKRPHSDDVEPHRKAKRQSRWGEEPKNTNREREGIESRREMGWDEHVSRTGALQNQDDVVRLPLERDIGNDPFFEGYPARDVVGNNEGLDCLERGPVDGRGFGGDFWGDGWPDGGRRQVFGEGEQERVEEQAWDGGDRKEGFPVTRKDTLSGQKVFVYFGDKFVVI